MQPSSTPSKQPTAMPTFQPSSQPSSKPSLQPSTQPSVEPSAQPSNEPSTQPSSKPSTAPSAQPSTDPSCSPSMQPSSTPSKQPTAMPTFQPSSQPSAIPSLQPSTQPSVEPSAQPTSIPSGHPSSQPSVFPSAQPTSLPSASPSQQPVSAPSSGPSSQPSNAPSMQPSVQPSGQPTVQPSSQPTSSPTPPKVPVSLWMEMLQEKISEAANENTQSYYEVIYDDSVYAGGCVDWFTFKKNLENALSKGQEVTSVSMYGLTGVLNPDIEEHCLDASIATNILENLLGLTDSTDTAIRSVLCAEVEWKLQKCVTNGVALCVGCLNPCSRSHKETPPMALFFNPCSENLWYPDTNLRLLQFFMRDTTVSVDISEISAVSHKRSMDISVMVESRAYVYCAAFEAEYFDVSKISLLQVIEGNQMNLSNDDNVATLNIQGLVPSTLYSVLCATKSPTSGLWLDDSKIRATESSFSTKCCIPLVLTLTTSTLLQDDMPFPMLTTSTEAQSSDAVVEITVLGVNTKYQSCTWSPRYIDLSVNMLHLRTVTTSISNCLEGNFTISVSLSGSDSDRYQVLMPTGFNFQVLSLNSILPVPKIISATFDWDLAYLLVYFDVATNMFSFGSDTGVFPCSKIFVFNAVTLSSCVWISKYTVSVGFMYESSLYPGDLIRLPNPSVLQQGSGSQLSHSFVQEVNASLSTTVSSIVPTVFVLAPSTCSETQSFELDISLSSGSGGRRWSVISFSVTSFPNDDSARLLQHYLNTNYSQSNSVVPGGLVKSSHVYNILVRLCNFASNCGENIFELAVSNITALSSFIVGPSIRKVKRNRVVILTAKQPSITNADDFNYKWKIFNGTVEEASILSEATLNSEPTTLRIPPYQLMAGIRYEVRLYILDMMNDLAVTSVVYLDVVKGDIVPMINTGTDISLPVGSTLKIDASKSYDSDTPDGVNDYFTYRWSCRNPYSVYSTATCDLMMQNDGPRLEVKSSSALESGNSYEVKLEILSYGRSAYRILYVHILASNPPITNVEYSQAMLPTKGYLQLEGSFLWENVGFASTNYTVEWTTNEPLLDLSPIALSAVSSQYEFPEQAVSTFNLVVPISRIRPYLSKPFLTFTLYCTFGNGLQSWASIRFDANTPPSSGVLEISPHRGIELHTVFALQALHWNDVDIPLTFEYVYSIGLQTPVLLKPKSDLSSHMTMLPSPSAHVGASNNLTIYLNVYDNLDAFTDVSRSVSVEPQFSYEEALVESYLHTADLTGSAIYSLQMGVMLSKVMNRVDCSGAPNCTSLHRVECSIVKNTCGPCISDDFTGEFGFSNSSCALKTSARMGTPVTGVLCGSDLDCPPLEFCSTALQNCTLRHKQCTFDCSSHGDCYFRDLVLGIDVSHCDITDSMCAGYCVCDVGYDGSSCEYTTSEFTSRKRFAQTFLARLSTGVETLWNEWDVSTLQQSFLNSFIFEPQVLSPYESSLVVQKQILQSSSLASATDMYTYVQSPMQLIEAITNEIIITGVTRRRRMLTRKEIASLELQTLNDPMLGDFSALFLDIFEIFEREMIEGQYLVTYVYSYYVYSFSVLPSHQKHFTLQAPLPSLTPRGSSEQQLRVTFNETGEGVHVGLIIENQLVLDSEFETISDAVALYISGNHMCTERMCSFSIEMPYYKEIDGLNVSHLIKSIRIHCRPKEIASLQALCPSGDVVDIFCDGVEGQYEIDCLTTVVPSIISSSHSSTTTLMNCTNAIFTMSSSTFDCSILDTRDVQDILSVQLVMILFNQSSVISQFVPIYRNVYELSLKVVFAFAGVWCMWMLVFFLGGNFMSSKKDSYVQKIKKTQTISEENLKLRVENTSDENLFSSIVPSFLNGDLSRVTPSLAELPISRPGLSDRVKMIFNQSDFFRMLNDHSLRNVMNFMNGNDDYLKIVFGDKRNRHRRLYLLLRAITRTTCSFFLILSMHIYLYGSDNQQSCWDLRTEETCMEKVDDAFGFFSRQCFWVESSDLSQPSCVLGDPAITLTTTILLALIGA